MIEFIENIVLNYLWGMPMVILILATGFYLTVKSNFFQFTKLGYALKYAKNQIFSKDSDSDGIVSAFEAVSIAIGTTVGVGNIGGVASAIALGGPGSVFWMWLAGIFGQIIKMVEITLAVHYRNTDSDGSTYGGPNYYIHKGIGDEKGHKKLAKFLSILFAFGFMVGFFINIQTYTVAEAIAGTFNINIVLISVVFTILLYIMISGGLSGLGKVASILVPFMVIFYLLGGLFIILKNISLLPYTIKLIFKSAFTPTAAMGGFVGSTVAQTIKIGMSRSVFSNEAGWGSSPMIHASAKTNHPIKQGLLGIFEVFVDTILVCSITAITIIITGQWSSGLDGATLTLSAFEVGIGPIARTILTIAIFLFGITTSSGLYAQMEVVVRYLVGDNKRKDMLLKIYKWAYPIPSLLLVIIAAYHQYPGSTVWLFNDISTALPIFANIVSILILSPKFFLLLKDYMARYMGIGSVDESIDIFYKSKK